MPQLLLCSSEGGAFQHARELHPFGADDRRRGSVRVENDGRDLYRRFDQKYSDFWVHIRFCNVGHFGHYAGTDWKIFEIRSGSTTIMSVNPYQWTTSGSDRDNLRIRFPHEEMNSDDSKWGTEDLGVAGYRWVEFDFRLRVIGNVLTVDVYKDGTLRETSVRPNVYGSLEPDTIKLNSYSDNISSVRFTAYQDIIVSDGVPTVGMALSKLVPGAVGSHDGFEGDYSGFHDPGYDPDAGISATSAGQSESWFSNPEPLRKKSKKIYGVGANFIAQTDAEGFIADFEPLVRVNGVDYFQGPVGADNVSPKPFFSVTTKNPETGQNWTVDELRKLEYGVRTI